LLFGRMRFFPQKPQPTTAIFRLIRESPEISFPQATAARDTSSSHFGIETCCSYSLSRHNKQKKSSSRMILRVIISLF
jgi:hypothetical protein